MWHNALNPRVRFYCIAIYLAVCQEPIAVSMMILPMTPLNNKLPRFPDPNMVPFRRNRLVETEAIVIGPTAF